MRRSTPRECKLHVIFQVSDFIQKSKDFMLNLEISVFAFWPVVLSLNSSQPRRNVINVLKNHGSPHSDIAC